MQSKFYLTRTVIVLSLVSLLNDVSSELLFPVMPVYLTTIGYSYIWIGVLEGTAEVIAGILKGYFGKLSDAKNRRASFVKTGYSLSAFGRMILLIANSIIPVFISRIADRVGKGVRTAPRDAMLASEASAIHSTKVFGFHRAMDTLGAVLGPALALIYLHYHPADYKGVFLFAALPTLAAALLTYILREKKNTPEHLIQKHKVPLFGFLLYWKSAPPPYRKLSIALFVFTLMNSSDVFLLLAIKKCGFNDVKMIAVYIFYNFCYAMLSFPIGALADRVGKYKVLLSGFVFFIMTYGGMFYILHEQLKPALIFFMGLFLVYALYAACNESVVKAIISTVVPDKERATALGFFTGVSSICAFFASAWTGIVWAGNASATAFLISACGAVAAIIILMLNKTPARFFLNLRVFSR